MLLEPLRRAVRLIRLDLAARVRSDGPWLVGVIAVAATVASLQESAAMRSSNVWIARDCLGALAGVAVVPLLVRGITDPLAAPAAQRSVANVLLLSVAASAQVLLLAVAALLLAQPLALGSLAWEWVGFHFSWCPLALALACRVRSAAQLLVVLPLPLLAAILLSAESVGAPANTEFFVAAGLASVGSLLLSLAIRPPVPH